MTNMTSKAKAELKILVANLIKQSFREGFNSYETACNSMIGINEAWEQSLSKTEYDQLMKDADDILFYS